MDSRWTEKILLTVREKDWKDGKGFGIWVVQKVCDGKSVEVTVRAGMYRTDAVTGEKKLPREGLTLKDFEALRPIFKEKIEPLLKIARGTPVPEDAESCPDPGPDVEECPF